MITKGPWIINTNRVSCIYMCNLYDLPSFLFYIYRCMVQQFIEVQLVRPDQNKSPTGEFALKYLLNL